MGLLSSSGSDSDESKSAKSESESSRTFAYHCRACGFGVDKILPKCAQCGYRGTFGYADLQTYAIVSLAFWWVGGFGLILAPIFWVSSWILRIFRKKGESPWEGVSRKKYKKAIR